jgi:O-glycosyl hydrolase
MSFCLLLAATTALQVTIRPNELRQPIYGFGGSITFNGDALIDYKGRDAVYRALFSDLKLDILRLRNYHDYEGQQASYERKTRDFARGARRWSGADKRGGKAPVRLMFTSWSPPARLKSNRLVSGRSDGTDKGKENVTLRRNADGAYAYGEFADWWLDSLRNFKTQVGVHPDYIALQNELDITVTYEGCEFLPEEGVGKDGFAFAGYDRALFAVSDRLKKALGKDAPKIVGPETFTIRPMPPAKTHVHAYANPNTEAGRRVLDRLWGVSYHLYGSEAETGKEAEFHRLLGAIRQDYNPDGRGKPLFQTEFLEGNSLTSVAGMISDALTHGNASAYLVWILARRADLPGYAAVFFNPYDGSIERRERFYALKHFSEYVGEGWTRVEASLPDPAVKVSAFVNKERLVAVLVNPSPVEKKAELTPPGYEKPVAHRSTEGDGGERWKELTGPVVLPPKSVVTIRWIKA